MKLKVNKPIDVQYNVYMATYMRLVPDEIQDASL
jgi:hypothetical protein